MILQDNLNQLLNQRTPDAYQKAAVLMQETAREMLLRLDCLTIKPALIVNISWGGKELESFLAERYPQSQIMTLHPSEIVSISHHTVDLITANLVLPWCHDFANLLQECKKMLKPSGVLMLSSLGPDTLRELQKAAFIVPHFVDMHDIGDLLIHTSFVEPVLDVDYVTFRYRDHAQLFHELQVTGMIMGNVHEVCLEKNTDSFYPITYEVIFGHAFQSDALLEHGADQDGIVRIPISHLSKR